MTIAPIEEDHESIIELWQQGHSPTQISKKTNVPRKEVQELINRFQVALRDDSESRDVARDLLNRMVNHYDRLIKESYDLFMELRDQPTTVQSARAMDGILNSIANFEKNRVDVVQKAGLIDAHDLGDEVARMEEEKAIILDILRNGLCEKCRPDVMRKIGEMSGRAEVVVVYDQ